MNDPAVSVQSVFGLAALIAGMCSRRLTRALLWSALIGGVCPVLITVVRGGGFYGIDARLFVEYLFITLMVGIMFGLIGYGIRRFFGFIHGVFARPQRPPGA